MTAFHNGLTLNDHIYTVDDMDKVIENVKSRFEFVRVSKRKGFWNIPNSFDIETSSFFRQSENGEESQKVAIMYVWTASIGGYVIMGRTWYEFGIFIDSIVRGFRTDLDHKFIIYVHNLAFDFSFFRKWLEWKNVFSLDNRKPVYAVTIDGIEFRCSYLLSGYKLEKVAEHLQHTDIKKLVGDLDYSLLRHSKTQLTDAEIQYCVNDVQIVTAYIYDCIREEGTIKDIPLTKTGYVRRYVRNMCFYPDGKPCQDSIQELEYKTMIHRLNLSLEEYYQLKRGFQGGFTHANPFYVGQVMENVASFDFTSSYPGVIVAEKFPMSSSELLEEITPDVFNYSLEKYCCLFELELFGLCSVLYYDSYISRYRCRELINPQINNGRIVRADHLKITVTEQDFFIIKKFYKWDKMRVGNFRRYKKGYLPTNLIKAVLQLYKDKTVLKGIKGKEAEYMRSKEMINSVYGMMVTDIVRELITYIDNMWENEPGREDEEKQEFNPEKEIIKYNKNQKRFLFYPWGVWVTAYARRNLFTAINEFGTDYIYSDTDSVKVLNYEAHIDYINMYNFNQRMKLVKAMQYHGLPIDSIEPKTNTGKKKMLGAWDFEGIYTRFKTLGAKRYMTDINGDISITVSGLNKKIATPYIIEASNNNPFEFFSDKMEIPGEYTGKQTHTYIDTPKGGFVTDYQGITASYYERSGVHLCSSPHKLSLASEFTQYLQFIRGLDYGNKVL